jgi:hypothetical protein
MGQFFPSGYEYGFVCPLGTLPTAIPRPACTGRSPQNSNNPITHSLSLPLSIAMQAALFWGSVGKNRERTARSTPGSHKKKKTPTLRRMRWHCAAMERPITRAIGYLPPLDASHQGLGRRTRTSIDRWQCMPHATLTHDDTRRNLPNAPSTTPENQVGTLLARPSVLTRGPAGPRLSRGSARQSAELHCTRSQAAPPQLQLVGTALRVLVALAVRGRHSGAGRHRSSGSALSARAAPRQRADHDFMGEFRQRRPYLHERARAHARGFSGWMRPDRQFAKQAGQALYCCPPVPDAGCLSALLSTAGVQ